MRNWLRGFLYSFPIQLLFLHLRRYQTLLIFWFILFSTVNGGFMKGFGADSLFLAPEYLGNVNAISAGLVGVSIGMFIMSWNISTFILFSKHFKFLAATTNPFLKYCINNAIIPFAYLLFYCWKAYEFTTSKELISKTEVLFLAGGFLSGFILLLTISFVYFFTADRTIFRRMIPNLGGSGEFVTHLRPAKELEQPESLIHVEYYLESPFKVRAVRDVRHYSPNFVEALFKRHHFSAIITIIIAFLLLVGLGFFMESPFFQLPAAASITILFTILIGISGALSYFLQSWTLPFMALALVGLNFLYKLDFIDPRNRAYGINYENISERPSYTLQGVQALCTPDLVEADKQNMIRILNNWKARQKKEKPMLVLLNTSGGGHRSATFTMSMLQELDSVTNGSIMENIFLINGASGGMLGATYFRELYLRKLKGENIPLRDKKYVDDIASDLLNPLFSSFVARDILSPGQKVKINGYEYIKDRGYSFENTLNLNTRGYLDKNLSDYKQDEFEARIPLIFYTTVITRDNRRLLMSTQPVSFMMQGYQDSTRFPVSDADLVDFGAFFKKQDPDGMRLLTAMRMNATFPIVLPNVWLPSNPKIDVMDAGMRDNYGQETSIRFLNAFDDWIKENTSGVLLLQFRDRNPGGWDHPYVTDDITDHLTKPFLLMNNNWFKMMDYMQSDMLSAYAELEGRNVYKILFQYSPTKETNQAALNFHLSKVEKLDIMASVKSERNRKAIEKLKSLLSQ